MVLIDHRRPALLGGVREAFESVTDERLGVARVDVVSARELTLAQRGAIVAEVGRVTGRQARAQFSIREDLIGGVVARVGSTVFDGSVRGQLEALKHRLAGAGT
jgi:F-type H+-transporting ATPase subunit delta